MDKVEAIGYLATFLTIVAFIPQAWRVYRLRETRDISLATFIFLLCGAITWTTYGILVDSTPIILTNVVIGILQSIIIGFKLKYG